MTTSPHISKPKGKRRFYLLKRIVVIAFALLVVAQVLLLYFANPLLKTTLKSKISTATEGVFDVDFDRVSINLTTQTIRLTDFKLSPNRERYNELKLQGKANKALYAINFKLLEISFVRVWRMLRHRELKIGRILLDRPLIRLIDLPEGKTKNKEKYDAVHEDLYPLLSEVFESVQILKVVINEGYFDFFLRKEGRNMVSTANNVTVELTNFLLNKENHKRKDRLFYADDIKLVIRDYVMSLKDSIHVLRAQEIGVSTSESEIYIDDVSMMPENVKRRNLPSLRKNYFKATIPTIKISGIVLADVYFDKNVDFDSMLLVEPHIQLFLKQQKTQDEQKNTKKRTTKNKEAQADDKELDLYELLKGKINYLNANTFSLANASIDIVRDELAEEPQSSVGSLSVNMYGFAIDSTSVRNRKKIFYADNIDLRITDYMLNLKDNLHKLRAKQLYISTKEAHIEAQEVFLQPTRNEGKSLLDIYIPQLSISGMNLHRAYNYKELPMAEFVLQQPRIDIQYAKDTNPTQQQKGQGQKKRRGDLAKIIAAYLHKISVDRLSVTESQFSIADTENGEQKTTSQGKMSLNLYNFLFDVDSLNSRNNNFYASDFDIALADYSSKLPDKLHILTIDTIGIKSQDSIIYLKKIQVRPILAYTSALQILRRQRSAIMDITVDELVLQHTDFKDFYFNKQLVISDVSVRRPNINITNYPHLRQKIKTAKDSSSHALHAVRESVADSLAADTLQLDVLDDLLAVTDSAQSDEKKNLLMILKQYADFVQVEHLSVSDGKFKMHSNDSIGNEMLTMDNNFELVLENFSLYTDSTAADKRLFFSDNIALQITKYRLRNRQKVYDVKADKITFEATNSDLFVSGLKIIPKKAMAEALQKKSYYKISLPELSVMNIDLERAYSKQEFAVGEILAKGADIEQVSLVRNDSAKVTLDKMMSQLKYIKPPRKLKLLTVNTISIVDGWLDMVKQNDTINNSIFAGRFDAQVQALRIDSAGTTFTANQVPFADNISLTLYDYRYEMPDSIHVFAADELTLSTKGQTIDATNVTFSYTKDDNTIDRLRDLGKTTLTDMDIETLQMEGVDFDRFYDKQQAAMTTAFMSNANIEVQNYPEFKTDTLSRIAFIKTEDQLVPTAIDFYGMIYPNLKQLEIQKFNFDNLAFNTTTHTTVSNKSNALHDLSGTLSGFLLDSLSYLRENSFYNADNIELRIREYEIPLKRSPYKIKLQGAGFSLTDSVMYAKSLSYVPKAGFYELSDSYETQKSVMDISAHYLVFEGMDFGLFLSENKIFARSLTIDSSLVMLYKDNTKPKPLPQLQPLLQTMLFDVNQTFKIDTIVAKRVYMDYAETYNENQKDATMTMDSMTVRMSNVTNDISSLFADPATRVNVNGYVMHNGWFDVDFVFQMFDKDSTYTYRGKIENMDLTTVNNFVEGVAKMTVKSGFLENCTFDIVAGDSLSRGSLSLRYRGLKVGVLNDEGNVGATQAIMGLVANRILKTDYPKRKRANPAPGKVFRKRSYEKTIVSNMVQAMLSGVKSSLGFEPKELKKEMKATAQSEKVRQKKTRQYAKNVQKWAKMKTKQQKQKTKTEKKIRKQQDKASKRNARKELRLQKKIHRKMRGLIEL